MPTESTLANMLKQRPEWVTAYQDRVAVLFRRSGE
jgi:hypothetical protein